MARARSVALAVEFTGDIDGSSDIGPERDGVHHGIDWFVMLQAAQDLHAVAVEPHLVSTPVVEPTSDGDSNVQHDFEPLL